jgi:hypothetical protein
MAESARARANRYARGDFTNAELKVLLGGMLADQVIDIATFGRLSALKGRAFQAAYRTISPLVAPGLRASAAQAAGTAVRLSGTAARVVGTVAMRHPYIAGAAIIYVSLKNRDAITRMLEEGWEIVSEGIAAAPTQAAIPGAMAIDLPGVPKRVKRAKSKFNKAISAGMKAIKRSKFLGKPGKFTNSKKAFGTVTRTVARLRKGAKVSSKGALGTIKRAVKRYT